MSSIFNFEKDVKAMNFEAPPVGEYELLLEKAELKTANSGNDMYSLTWVICEGDYINRKVWDYLVLIPSCAFKFKQLMDGMGIDIPNEMSMEDIESLFSPDSENCIVGETVLAKLKHETYEGKTNAKIHYYIASKEGETKEEDNIDLGINLQK